MKTINALKKLCIILAIGIVILSVATMKQFERINTCEALLLQVSRTMLKQDSIIKANEMHIMQLEDLWFNSIYNPHNLPYMLEVAFNLSIPIDSVTQAQFNERYLINRIKSMQ